MAASLLDAQLPFQIHLATSLQHTLVQLPKRSHGIQQHPADMGGRRHVFQLEPWRPLKCSSKQLQANRAFIHGHLYTIRRQCLSFLHLVSKSMQLSKSEDYSRHVTWKRAQTTPTKWMTHTWYCLVSYSSANLFSRPTESGTNPATFWWLHAWNIWHFRHEEDYRWFCRFKRIGDA